MPVGVEEAHRLVLAGEVHPPLHQPREEPHVHQRPVHVGPRAPPAADHPAHAHLLARLRQAELGSSLQQGSHLSRLLIFLLGTLHLTGNNQRGAGLINQDRIHLVDHAVLEWPLHNLANIRGHIVAQIIKPQL